VLEPFAASASAMHDARFVLATSDFVATEYRPDRSSGVLA
jgi:hypothetical protein